MKPIEFDEATKTLGRPVNMTDEECCPLPVWGDGNQLVSCWKPSLKERFKIMFGGNVWLTVLSGRTQPPVYVGGEHPFIRPSFWARLGALILDGLDFIAFWVKNTAKGLKRAENRKYFFSGIIVCAVVAVLFHILRTLFTI